MNLIVIAKAPAPGTSKTRLTPPYTPPQAARLAEAALSDTLAVVMDVADVDPVLVLDGEPGPWTPDGMAVVRQRGDGLASRLAAAFIDAGAPALLIGMDTPQVTPELLAEGIEALRGADAVLGCCPDGGYWAIGLQRADPAVFDGVPMSADDTAQRQLERLASLGLRVKMLPEIRDVDDADDAAAVAAQAPDTRFAALVRDLT